MRKETEFREASMEQRLMQATHSRRGFSFAEVMFAVVILGIGFIMVAAVFPVAIRQTQSTGEENNAAIAARSAANAIAKQAMTQLYVYGYNSTYTDSDPFNDASGYLTIKQFPTFAPTVKNYAMPTGVANVVAPPAIVVPFVGARWDQLKGNVIQNIDPRYSYQAFYRRENNASVAQLIVVAVANRNQPTYSQSDYDNSTLHYPVLATFTRNPAYLNTAPPSIINTTIIPDTIAFSPTGVPTPASGSYEGCTMSLLWSPPVTAPYAPAARTYSIGRLIDPSTNQYEISAGDGLELTPDSNGLWGEAPLNQKLSDPICDPTAAASTMLLNLPSHLQATTAYVSNLNSTTSNPAGLIVLDTDSTSFAGPTAAVPGAFVIIADDFPIDMSGSSTPPNYAIIQNYSYSSTYPTIPSYRVGALNGRIFRLGQAVTQITNPSTGATSPQKPGTFYLDPAYGMQATQGQLKSADTFPPPAWPVTPNPRMKCYIIGAGQNTTGTAQDIGVFTTYIPVQ